MELKMGSATRDAYGKTLAEIGQQDPRIVVLDADLSKSTMTKYFAAACPDRFFNIGIAEANMVGIAAGLASAGKIPFASSFACFVMCKGFDQLRLAVAYSGMNVKIVASHAGISIGEDGVSQMSVEDVALACALPGFTVVVPADEVATRAAIHAVVEHVGPCYVRVGRPKVPIVYPDGCDFQLGRALMLRDGGDVTIIANGLLVAEALKSAEALEGEGITARVLDMHTVKPIDVEAVAAAARDTGAIVVAEEHMHHGGLGSAVAMAAGTTHPVPLGFVDLKDTYAESGTGDALLDKYGMRAADITAKVHQVLQR